MERSFFITEENLIGSMADAILQLKKIKNGKEGVKELAFFLKLIDFIKKANNENYEELLFDKHFIISKEVLSELHDEFKEHDISRTIDFTKIQKACEELFTDSSIGKIDELMGRIMELAKVLLQFRAQRKINI